MSMPPLISKYKTPKIFWYQNDNSIIIRIMLCDVNHYFLRIVPNHLKFSCSVQDNDYCLCFRLFGGVRPEETDHVNLGREIKVTLSKACKFVDWLRLTFHKEKNPLVVVDPDHIYKREWNNPNVLFLGRESFADYKIKNNITNINPVVPSSDEEESDDERWQLASYD